MLKLMPKDDLQDVLLYLDGLSTEFYLTGSRYFNIPSPKDWDFMCCGVGLQTSPDAFKGRFTEIAKHYFGKTPANTLGIKVYQCKAGVDLIVYPDHTLLSKALTVQESMKKYLPVFCYKEKANRKAIFNHWLLALVASA